MDVRVKRVYDEPSDDDGERILVDRLWPRGLTKEKARLDEWMKDVAPTPELRKWFAHDAAKWDEFQRRYTAELDDNADAVKPLAERARAGRVTLLYATRDPERNSAALLAAYLRRHARG
jgi:uncharacterized protein YeaO (DUF488 family)